MPVFSSIASKASISVFSLAILISYLAHTEAKVFLVGTETVRSNRDMIGEDYMNSFGQEYVYKRDCQNNCNMGLCQQNPNPHKDITMFLSKYIYTCLPRKLVVPAPAPPPTTIAPMANDDCLKTPRSRKGRVKKWGFRVKKLRGRSNFCCTKGPRTGDMVRTLRCCKPRTPRWSCP